MNHAKLSLQTGSTLPFLPYMSQPNLQSGFNMRMLMRGGQMCSKSWRRGLLLGVAQGSAFKPCGFSRFFLEVLPHPNVAG